MSFSYNSIEIDLAALRENYRFLQKKVQGADTQILAMVKSDAYGHGLLESVVALRSVGAQYFGVAEIDEGVRLREADVDGEIVIMLGSCHYDEIVHYDLSPVVFNSETLASLSAAAVRGKKQIGVHLKVDVGMGRIGILPGQLNTIINQVYQLPGIYLAGLMGHFPCADDCDKERVTLDQLRLFSEAVDRYFTEASRQLERKKPFLHIANSAAIFHYPESFLQLVRPGISLYGYHPCGSVGEDVGLQPVMRFKTSVLQVKMVPEGSGISYGHQFRTEKPSTLAILPVGYADGYLRGLTGQAEVLIHGQRAPIRGRICMNACIADVSDIESVQPGDEVVLLGCQSNKEGKQKCISADEIAGWLNTISYEVLCLFGNSNDRIYLK